MRQAAWILITALALLAPPALPTAMAAPDCDGPYCCDRNPLEIAQRYLNAGIDIVLEAVARAGQSAGKVKCTAYEVAFLCSDETFPPQLSVFRTNPTNTHGYYSPCFEVFLPGFEYMGGCSTAQALRHTFTASSHTHSCVSLERIVLPS